MLRKTQLGTGFARCVRIITFFFINSPSIFSVFFYVCVCMSKSQYETVWNPALISAVTIYKGIRFTLLSNKRQIRYCTNLNLRDSLLWQEIKKLLMWKLTIVRGFLWGWFGWVFFYFFSFSAYSRLIRWARWVC